jgi:hypothetical protein
MPVLEKPLALLREVLAAEKARATTDGDRPRHTAADAYRFPGGIRPRRFRSECLNPTDDLVPEHGGNRLGAETGVGMQVAAA